MNIWEYIGAAALVLFIVEVIPLGAMMWIQLIDYLKERRRGVKK